MLKNWKRRPQSFFSSYAILQFCIIFEENSSKSELEYLWYLIFTLNMFNNISLINIIQICNLSYHANYFFIINWLNFIIIFVPDLNISRFVMSIYVCCVELLLRLFVNKPVVADLRNKLLPSGPSRGSTTGTCTWLCWTFVMRQPWAAMNILTSLLLLYCIFLLH